MDSLDHAATTLEMVKLMMTLATRPAGSFRYKLMVSGAFGGDDLKWSFASILCGGSVE